MILCNHHAGSHVLELKELKDIMRKQKCIINKWYDIGLELLGDAEELEIIKQNNPRDIDGCCTEMFHIWLQRDPDASWNKVIITLDKIGLNAAARHIKGW